MNCHPVTYFNVIQKKSTDQFREKGFCENILPVKGLD